MRAICITLLISANSLLFAADKPAPSHNSTHGVTITKRDFHGWPAIVLRNHSAEAVIVPAIGRVMQFSLRSKSGDVEEGPFWNAPGIGTQLKPDAEGWANFGGDKAWPAPQSDWPKIAGAGWPPPKGFDATPYDAQINGSTLELLSPVDSWYGMRIRRIVTLDSRKPVMSIETTYEKVSGERVHVAVWTISQLASPDRAFILLAKHSSFAGGYHSFLPSPPEGLKRDGRLLSITRSAEHNTMIGSDGVALLWIGNGPDLLIRSTQISESGSSEWPEQGSHTKIYTNGSDQMKYVELELLGPLSDLKPGDKASMTTSYSLIRRTHQDAQAEARKIFARE